MDQTAFNLFHRNNENLPALTQAQLDGITAKRNNLTDRHPGDLEVSLVSTDISAVAAADHFASTPEDFVAEGFEVGQYVTVSGFTESENNGTFEVTAVNSAQLSVNAALTNEAVGDSITIVVEDTWRRGAMNIRHAENHNLPASALPTS